MAGRMHNTEKVDFPIPEKLNVVIFAAVLPVIWLLLWVSSHLSVWWALAAAFLFAHFSNTIFSLLHESVHGVFSERRFKNDLFGLACAAVFPTSLTLQRVAHLGHHRRNRTDQDLHDYYLPDQSRALRNFQLYAGNLFGLYWFCIPLSNLIYLFTPWLYTSKWFVQGPARFLGFEPYVKEIAQQGIWQIWLECLWALAYQIAIWIILDLSWQGWLLCYLMFALHWSALQYVVHAWSPRDVINGAWNLRVTPLAMLMAINYHCHLAHHQHPQVAWLYLPGLVDEEQQRPTFWSIYFSLWKGVKPAPPLGSQATFT